jgi:hypothetical protein
MTEKLAIAAEDIETAITYSKHTLGEWAELYTTDKVVMKRYVKFAEKYPDACRLKEEDQYSMTFLVHPKCAGIYPKAPRMNHLTDEQKQANAERLKMNIGDKR